MAAKRYLSIVSGAITEIIATITSAGAGNSGDLVALDAAGKLDLTVMPTGVGPDTASIVTSENLAAGDLVNVYNNGGVATARKADASAAGKEALGFVLSAVTSPAAAVVYGAGNNSGVSGLTPGAQYLSASTPGRATSTAPTGSAQVVQRVGVATAAGNLNFEFQVPVTLAT